MENYNPQDIAAIWFSVVFFIALIPAIREIFRAYRS